MKNFSSVAFFLGLSVTAMGSVEVRLTPFSELLDRNSLEIKNDGYAETGGPAYLQQGFVKGEKAGVWVKVPAGIPRFKVDFFRVLVGGGEASTRLQVFFQMASTAKYMNFIPNTLENAAQLTPGPYWNDIPAQGYQGEVLPCIAGGGLVGGAIEFTHDGIPSVYRDHDGMGNAAANLLFAIPGGWAPSANFGLTGDWILRIVGHAATEAECQ